MRKIHHNYVTVSIHQSGLSRDCFKILFIFLFKVLKDIDHPHTRFQILFACVQIPTLFCFDQRSNQIFN